MIRYRKLLKMLFSFVIITTLLPVINIPIYALGEKDSSSISAGGPSLAIKDDGSLWAWGVNYGQFNNKKIASSSTPMMIMENVKSVSAGGNCIMIIKSDSSLWAWGQNAYGQLGNGTTNHSPDAPVKVMDNVVSVSAGEFFTLAVKSDGSLWAWGINDCGQLGDGTAIDRSTPIKIMDNVTSASAGYLHNMAIKDDGSLWAWGNNGYGQLGNVKIGSSSIPDKIMDNVMEVSVGEYHSVAIKSDGSLWAWGSNWSGQLGDASIADSFTPVKVMDNVVSVSTGRYFTMAVKSDDSLWAWGSNQNGTLGDGTTINRFTPVKIMDAVATVSTGYGNTFAVKSDGSLWAWGENANGALGDGTTTNRSTPVKIMDGVKISSSPTTTKPTPEIPLETDTLSFSLGIKISWSPSSNPLGYNIYRSKVKDEQGVKINSQPVLSGEYIDVTVEPHTTYYYTIYAIVQGEGGQLSEKAVVNDPIEATTEEILAGIEGRRGFILMRIDKDTMIVNGNIEEIDPGRGTVPQIKDGRTLLPIRAVIEAMSGNVAWDAGENRVSMSALGHVVDMWIGSKKLTVDGRDETMDIAPEIINDRTMLPLRFVAENIGCLVEWIGSTREVVIVYPLQT